MATYQDLLNAAMAMAKKAGQGKERMRGPGNWLTCCPVPTHGKGQGDQDPSLIIRVDQQINFKCLAGTCDDESIRTAFADLGFVVPIATGSGSAAGTILNKVAHEERPSDEWVISTLKPRRAPDAVYIYRNEQGGTAFCIVRINPIPPAKSKFIRAITSHRQQGGTTDFWLDSAYPKGARPLYNLPELARRPDAPVVVVEGEKAAEAAMRLLPDHVVTTWAGGASAQAFSVWASLNNREVFLWPDNDEAGIKAMRDVASRIIKGRNAAKSVKLVFEEPVETFPVKWDLGDPYEDTYTPINYMLEHALEIDPRKLAEVLQPADDEEIAQQLQKHLDKYVAVLSGTDVLYVNVKSGNPFSTDAMPYVCHSKAGLEKLETARYRAGDRPRTFIKNYLDSDKKTWARGWVYDPLTNDRILPFGADMRLNLYCGLAFPPKQCDEARYIAFIQHIRASCGTEGAADYLLDWLAFKVQYPHRMVETMIILSGPEGCGKSIICDVMRLMLGAHNAVQITSQDLKRDFNEHYANKLFIAVEEYMPSNSKAWREYRGKIKNLITSKYMIVNGKFMPTYQNPAYHSVIATTNATNPEDVSFDNRRMSFIPFFNPELRKEGQRLIGSEEYFRPIVELQKDAEGLCGLCHYLANRVITSRVLKPFDTKMTEEALSFTDNPVLGFLHTLAETGTLPDSEYLPNNVNNKDSYSYTRWPEQAAALPRKILSQMFQEWCQRYHHEDITPDKVGKMLMRTLPRAPRGISTEFDIDKSKRWDVANKQGTISGIVDRSVCLPSLEELREIVEKAAGTPIRWSAVTKEDVPSDNVVVEFPGKLPKEF